MSKTLCCLYVQYYQQYSVVVEHFLTLYGLENFVRTSTYKSVWVGLLKTMSTYHFTQNFVRTSPDVRIHSYTPAQQLCLSTFSYPL